MKNILLLSLAGILIFALSCKKINEHEFDNGSKIASIKLDSEKTNNLVILGKVWGFLKYYHPSVREGKYNWDYELFRIMPSILNSKTINDRNDILLKWVYSLGYTITEPSEKIDSSQVKMFPDLDWINDVSQLGMKLSGELNRVKNAKRNDRNYYFGHWEGSHLSEVKNENSYYQFHYPDCGFHLLSLFRYWNIIQYYYPYKYLITENWNTILPQYIPIFINASNELEYKLAFLSLKTHIHDSHGYLLSYDNSLNNYFGNLSPKINVSFIENKVVVTETEDNSTTLNKGDVLLKINEKDINEKKNELLTFTAASNLPAQLLRVSSNILSTNDSIINITYQRNDIIKNINIHCYPRKLGNPTKRPRNNDTCFKYLSPSIFYINPGNIKSQYINDTLYSQIKNTKGIIIDLRYYPTDGIIHLLLHYLYPDTISFAKATSANLISPGLFQFEDNITGGNKNPDYYKGKVVIIVNEKTQSHGEFSAMAYRTTPKATVIGSTTAGADGNVVNFYLPGGILTLITGIGIYYPDGRETQRVGIVPDIEVHPTIKGIREGRDELLEKAIEIINKD